MSQRERHARDGGPTAVAGRPAREVPPAAPAWDDVALAVPPARKAELLEFARRHGAVLPHHLPPATAVVPAAERPRTFLARLPAGTDDLPTPDRPDVTFFDADLDAAQREAVVRALGTPDICLVQGGPGSGKGRVTAELVRQAVARGESVLLASAVPHGIDRVLERVEADPAVSAHRCLGRDEVADTLPRAAARATEAGRARHLSEHTLPRAVAAVEAAAERVRSLDRAEELLTQAADLAAQAADAQARAAALRAEREAVPAAVREAADGDRPLAAALRELAAGHAEALAGFDAKAADIDADRSRSRGELDGLTCKAETVRSLADAKRSGKWWSGSYWKAALSGDVVAECDDLDGRVKELEAALADCDVRAATLADERQAAEAADRHERAKLVRAETDRRLADLADREAAAERERGVAAEKWQQTAESLPAELRPDAMTAEAVEPCRARRTALLDAAKVEENLAREWAGLVAAHADDLLAHLRSGVNVVAGLSGAVGGDPFFGQRAFDLLVVDDAQFTTESEFLQLARRASRWVLVADAAAVAPKPESRSRVRPPARTGPRLPTMTGFFRRVWQHLHHDGWVRDGDGRLVCRLVPVPAERRRELETEPVADHPDVELRIWSRPTGPQLAEVAFPPQTPPAEAARFVAAEVGSLPVRCPGGGRRWADEGGRLTLRFAGHDGGEPAEVEPGVRALVRTHSAAEGPACCVAGLSFDAAAGWDRPTAEEWLARSVVSHDTGRTVRLDRTHRGGPVAGVLAQLFPEFAAAPESAAAEFVAVPPADGEFRRPNGSVNGQHRGDRRNLPRGAGLETDLADPKQRERLPADLRDVLPPTGVVNVPEARAVVARLAELAGRSAAVVAFVPAQVALLRHLVSRSAAPGTPVAEPDALRRQEFDTVLVGLTRSHANRTVPLADDAAAVLAGLSRVRQELVLFGDPGTLARRAAWDGPVEHLEGPAAERERELAAALLRLVHDGTVRLVEGPRP